MQYLEFKGDAYTAFRKELLDKNKYQLRLEFLENVRDTDKFIEYMAKIDKTNGDELPTYQGLFTEDECKNMPFNLSQELYDTWRNLSPAIACRSPFWACVTVQHIKKNKIESHYLASNGDGQSSGKSRIDAVLNTNDPNKIDKAIRDVLRRLGGIPEARGNRTVYVDCVFGRAWWRNHTAEIIANESGDDIKDIHKLFSRTQADWEQFANLVLSKNSVLGDSRIRSAFVSCLLTTKNNIGDKSFYDGFAKKLNTAQRLIGVKQALQELGVMDINQLKDIFNDDIIANLFKVNLR